MAGNRVPGGQSAGVAKGSISIDTTGFVQSGRVVDSVSQQMVASTRKIDTSLKSVAENFLAAQKAAQEFKKSDLGIIQRGLEGAARATAGISAVAGGLTAVGLAAANNLNVVNARFTVFLGSAKAAHRELDNIRKQADATGQPFLELADTASQMLGLTKSYNVEVGKLVTLSQQLQAVDPTARAFDVSVATREFLSGNTASLQRRFEGLDPNELDKIVKGSTDAGDRINKLSKYLNDLGFGTDLLKKFGDEGLYVFGQLKSEVSEAMGTAFMPLLKDFVLPAAQGFAQFVRQLRETNPELLKLGAAGAVALAGIAPLLFGLSQLIGAYKNLKIVSGTPLGGGLMKAAGVGIAGAAGVGVGLAGANLLARSGVQSGDLGRIRAGESAQDILGERLKQIVVIVVDALLTLAKGLTQGGAFIFNAIDQLVNVFKLGGAAIGTFFGKLQEGLGNILVGLADALSGVFDTTDLRNSGRSNQAQGQQRALDSATEGERLARRLAEGFTVPEETRQKIDSSFEDLRKTIVGGLTDAFFPAQKAVEEGGQEVEQSLKKTAGGINSVADSVIANQEAIEKTAQQINELNQNFEEETRQIEADRALRQKRQEFDEALQSGRSKRDQGISDARKLADFLRNLDKGAREFQEGMTDLEREAYARRLELLRSSAEQQERDAEDHGKRLEEIQLRTQTAVQNAAASLDANAVFQALQSGVQDVGAENSSFNTEQKRKQEDLNLQLTQLAEGLAQQQDERRKAYGQQLADQVAAFQLQQEQERQDRELRAKDEAEDKRIRAQRQQEDFALEDARRRAALQKQINDQLTALAQTTQIQQNVLTTVVNTLAAAGGHVANFVNFVNSTLAMLPNGGQTTSGGGSANTIPWGTTLPTAKFAGGGRPVINKPFRANELGLESAIINNKYMAMLTQPAQILPARETQQLLGGGGGRSISATIQSMVNQFGDIGSHSPAMIEDMIRASFDRLADELVEVLA